MSSYKKSKKFHKRGFIHSINAALEGIVHTLRTERNMRVHFLASFLVLVGGIYLNLNAIEFMLLLFAMTFVLVAEMFNTAIEYSIDLISEEYNPLAKIVKDIAAGAVFVSVVNAILTAYILTVERIDWHVSGAFSVVKQSPWNMTLIVLLSVVGLVLLIKIMRGEETLLKGGMPSGHSAVAFAVWILVTLFTENVLVCVLVFVLSFLVARSRLSGGIHTLWEVIAGSVLGALVTLMAFQLLM